MFRQYNILNFSLILAVMLNGAGRIYAVNITHHLRAFKESFQLLNCVFDYYEEVRTYHLRALTTGLLLKKKILSIIKLRF